MVSKKRNVWKGWKPASEFSPELLEKKRKQIERYHHYRDKLAASTAGTGNGWDAHVQADRDVGMTAAENEELKRLDPNYFAWLHKE